MTTREAAQRLADALENPDFIAAYTCREAAQLLRQWPEPGEPVAWRHSKTLCLYDTEKDCQLADGDEWAEPLYAAPGAAPSQQPAPARPDEFVCPHCFDEGAAPQAAQSGMVPADCEHKRALWNITFTSGVCRDCDSKWTASGGWVAAAPQAVLLTQDDIVDLAQDWAAPNWQFVFLNALELELFARRVLLARAHGITAKGDGNG